MRQTRTRQSGARRGTQVLSAALGAALLLPALACAGVHPPRQPVPVAGEAGPAWPDSPDRMEIKRLIVAEAVDDGAVPAPLALAVADVASDFVPGTFGYSGTIGLMQLHPEVTKSEFGVDADALRDPATNVRLGLRWLARLHQRYDGDWELALSHFRGGELAQVDGRYRAHEFAHAWVRRVMRCWRYYQSDLLVRAWIRQASGAQRFVSDEVRPRSWVPGRYDGHRRAHAYETYGAYGAYRMYPNDYRPGRFRSAGRRCDDTMPAYRPAPYRFRSGGGWTAIEGTAPSRYHRGGRWAPVTGDGGGRFR